MFPRNSFLRVLPFALIALALLSSACSSRQKGPITRQQVLALLEEIDNAAKKRDVEGLASHFSRDAQLKVTIEGFGPGVQTLNFNREQYLDYSKQALDAMDAYDFKRGETVINIDADGQTAFVADESFETFTIRGQVMRSTARSMSTLKLEDGRLVITASESRAHVSTGPTPSKQASFR
ncbi:MAG TPA: hypothetical protein VF791_24185 [Pyrinomonadaceae bacterium]